MLSHLPVVFSLLSWTGGSDTQIKSVQPANGEDPYDPLSLEDIMPGPNNPYDKMRPPKIKGKHGTEIQVDSVTSRASFI